MPVDEQMIERAREFYNAHPNRQSSPALADYHRIETMANHAAAEVERAKREVAKELRAITSEGYWNEMVDAVNDYIESLESPQASGKEG